MRLVPPRPHCRGRSLAGHSDVALCPAGPSCRHHFRTGRGQGAPPNPRPVTRPAAFGSRWNLQKDRERGMVCLVCAVTLHTGRCASCVPPACPCIPPLSPQEAQVEGRAASSVSRPARPEIRVLAVFRTLERLGPGASLEASPGGGVVSHGAYTRIRTPKSEGVHRISDAVLRGGESVWAPPRPLLRCSPRGGERSEVRMRPPTVAGDQ